jgi:DNA-directed RNA polymerase specialized sigma24 family protein
MNGLPDLDRVALEMYVVDGVPAADVARVLGLSNAKAVYNRVYRSLAALRERLQSAGLSFEDL